MYIFQLDKKKIEYFMGSNCHNVVIRDKKQQDKYSY